MRGTTKRQSEVLRFIEEFIATKNYSPSYREIQHHFGFSSLGSVYNHLEMLKKKNLIKMESKSRRSITPIHEQSAAKERRELEVPFIGHIAAGFPIETFSKSLSIAVPEYLVQDISKTYVLQARGDTLQEEMIADGDLLIIEARQTVSPGETVVAIINQRDSLVKRYYPEGDDIRLAGNNPHQQPFIVRQEDIFIQGVLVGLIRQFY